MEPFDSSLEQPTALRGTVTLEPGQVTRSVYRPRGGPRQVPGGALTWNLTPWSKYKGQVTWFRVDLKGLPSIWGEWTGVPAPAWVKEALATERARQGRVIDQIIDIIDTTPAVGRRY